MTMGDAKTGVFCCPSCGVEVGGIQLTSRPEHPCPKALNRGIDMVLVREEPEEFI